MGLYQNRIIVKVDTSTLTNEIGKSDLRAIDRYESTTDKYAHDAGSGGSRAMQHYVFI